MALHMADEVDANVDAATLQAYVDRSAEFDDRHAFWLKDIPEGDTKQIKTVGCFEPAAEFYHVMNSEFIPACLAGDKDKANLLTRGVLRQHYGTHRNAIDKVVAMATEMTSQAETEFATIVYGRISWSIAFIVGAIVSDCWIRVVCCSRNRKSTSQISKPLAASLDS
jgi:hypothetical protein